MKKNATPKKKEGKRSGNRASDLILSKSASYLSTLSYEIPYQNSVYLYVWIEIWIFWPKGKHPRQGDDTSTAEAAPGRVGRDEQGEVHRAITTPNSGPHLEVGRLRLKSWSKSDFSTAETTWPTYLYILKYMHIYTLIGCWNILHTTPYTLLLLSKEVGIDRQCRITIFLLTIAYCISLSVVLKK